MTPQKKGRSGLLHTRTTIRRASFPCRLASNSSDSPHIRGITHEHHQHRAVHRRSNKHLLPLRLRRHGASSGKQEREDEDSQDLRRGSGLDLRGARGLDLEEDEDGDEEQGGGGDGEYAAEEDVQAGWGEEDDVFGAGDDFLVFGAEEGL